MNENDTKFEEFKEKLYTLLREYNVSIYAGVTWKDDCITDIAEIKLIDNHNYEVFGEYIDSENLIKK